MARQGYPPLSTYRLAGRSLSSTITGHFIDTYGQIAGDPFSGSVDSASWSTLGDIAGYEIPGSAIGCILGSVSADTVILTTDSTGAEPDLALAQANSFYHVAGTTGISLGVVE